MNPLCLSARALFCPIVPSARALFCPKVSSARALFYEKVLPSMQCSCSVPAPRRGEERAVKGYHHHYHHNSTFIMNHDQTVCRREHTLFIMQSLLIYLFAIHSSQKSSIYHTPVTWSVSQYISITLSLYVLVLHRSKIPLSLSPYNTPKHFLF